MRERAPTTPAAFFVGNICIDRLTDPKGNETQRSLGGSAANACAQASKLGVASELCAAIGNDREGRYVLEELERRGQTTNGITVLDGYTTLVYTQQDTGGEDVIITKNHNPATDAHTLDMVTAIMPEDLTGKLVYTAGLARKRAAMTHFALENTLDELRKRGATIAMDLGRAPSDSPDSLHRSQTFMNYPPNRDRVDFWALNEGEFAKYLGLSEADKQQLLHASEAQVKQLVDRYIMDDAQPALVCITLGRKGLFLHSRTGETALIEAPSARDEERRTKVGLGDSTKAGMIAAILHETNGAMSPDILAS